MTKSSELIPVLILCAHVHIYLCVATLLLAVFAKLAFVATLSVVTPLFVGVLAFDSIFRNTSTILVEIIIIAFVVAWELSFVIWQAVVAWHNPEDGIVFESALAFALFLVFALVRVIVELIVMVLMTKHRSVSFIEKCNFREHTD